MYKFSNQPADCDSVALWQLQQYLLSECENRLGKKAKDEKVYRPIIRDNRPHVINEKSGDGANTARKSYIAICKLVNN